MIKVKIALKEGDNSILPYIGRVFKLHYNTDLRYPYVIKSLIGNEVEVGIVGDTKNASRWSLKEALRNIHEGKWVFAEQPLIK